MVNIVQQLKDQETVIRGLQNKQARQDGQRQQLFEQLKTDFKLETLESAVTELENTQVEITKNGQELEALAIQMDNIINAAGTVNSQPTITR